VLGADVADVIPDLLRLTDPHVQLPRLEVVALQKVAAHEGRAVDAVLAAGCSTSYPRTRDG